MRLLLMPLLLPCKMSSSQVQLVALMQLQASLQQLLLLHSQRQLKAQLAGGRGGMAGLLCLLRLRADCACCMLRWPAAGVLLLRCGGALPTAVHSSCWHVMARCTRKVPAFQMPQVRGVVGQTVQNSSGSVDSGFAVI